MGTPYEIIYNRCLSRIDDPTLLMLTEEDMENMLHGWLMSAIVKMRKRQSDDFSRDDELKQFNSDLSDTNIEILSLLMAREWVSSQINSITLTLQTFTGKESTFFSQAAHLKELMALDDKWKIEAQQLSRDNTYADNEYLNG